MVNAASALAVALPLYNWPSSGAWDPVFDTISNHPSTTFNIIVNPDSGPGSFPPNSDYRAGVAQLNSYNNVNLFGYVHTSFTGRPVEDVAADVKTYASWETYEGSNLHLEGVFVDEAPDNNYDNGVQYMADLATQIYDIMPEGNLIWTNPGCVVQEAYYDHADIITAFEDTFSYWNSPSRPPIPDHVHNKTSVMITDFTGAEAGISSEVDTLLGRGFHSAFMFGTVGYQGFSTVWGQFAEAVTAAV